MGREAILPPVSTAERHPAAPADTPQRSIAVTAIPLVHGASIRIRSIAEAKPAPAAARLPTIMPTIRMIHVPFRCDPSRRMLPVSFSFATSRLTVACETESFSPYALYVKLGF